MSTTVEIGWLVKACAAPSILRPQMEKVGLIRYADASWSIATNGHILVALRGEHVVGAVDAAPGIASLAIKALSETEDAGLPAVDPAALLIWADLAPPTEPPAETCATCGGTNEVDCDECDGTGEVECDMGFPHDCEDCEGKGHIPCEHVPPRPEYRPGLIDGVPFNRDNFWPLAHVTGPARMRAGTIGLAPMLLRGDGWLFVVMPMSANTGGGPAFSTPGAAQ